MKFLLLAFCLTFLFANSPEALAGSKKHKAKGHHSASKSVKSAKHRSHKKTAKHKTHKPNRNVATKAEAERYFRTSRPQKDDQVGQVNPQDYVKNFKANESYSAPVNTTEIPQTRPNEIPDMNPNEIPKQASLQNSAPSVHDVNLEGSEYYNITPPGDHRDDGGRYPYERVQSGFSTAFPDIERPEIPQ
jgi:hypothetical protein